MEIKTRSGANLNTRGLSGYEPFNCEKCNLSMGWKKEEEEIITAICEECAARISNDYLMKNELLRMSKTADK